MMCQVKRSFILSGPWFHLGKKIVRQISISKVQPSNKVRVYDLRTVIRQKTEKLLHTFHLSSTPYCNLILNAFFGISLWVVCSACSTRIMGWGQLKQFIFLVVGLFLRNVLIISGWPHPYSNFWFSSAHLSTVVRTGIPTLGIMGC